MRNKKNLMSITSYGLCNKLQIQYYIKINVHKLYFIVEHNSFLSGKTFIQSISRICMCICVVYVRVIASRKTSITCQRANITNKSKRKSGRACMHIYAFLRKLLLFYAMPRGRWIHITKLEPLKNNSTLTFNGVHLLSTILRWVIQYTF